MYRSRIMFFKIAIFVVISLAFPIIAASGTVRTRTNDLTILPEDCTVLVGEEMPLALDGAIPSSSVVSWDVDYGGIGTVLPGRNAVLVAPSKPGMVTVSVTIWPPLPGPETPITRQCIVTSSENVPD
jgi:hypothetical protein